MPTEDGFMLASARFRGRLAMVGGLVALGLGLSGCGLAVEDPLSFPQGHVQGQE